MILKLGMMHQEYELYKVYINHDLWMTLTYFMARPTKVTHAFEWGKFMLMKQKCPQGVVCPCPGAIYMYMTIISKLYVEHR